MSEEQISLFPGVELFEPLSPEEISRIAGGIPAKSFLAGQQVFTPAHRGEIFYLLLEGRVRVFEKDRYIIVKDLDALRRAAS